MKIDFAEDFLRQQLGIGERRKDNKTREIVEAALERQRQSHQEAINALAEQIQNLCDELIETRDNLFSDMARRN